MFGTRNQAGLPSRPLETAISFAEQQDWTKAIELFERLRADRPDSKRVKLWLGYCLLEAGEDTRRGYRLLGSVVRSLAAEGELPVQRYPLPDDALEQAIALTGEENWSEATRMLELCHAARPDAKRVGMWLGYALVEGNSERNADRQRGIRLLRKYVPHFDGEDCPPVELYSVTGAPAGKAIRAAKKRHWRAAIRALEMQLEERPDNKRLKVWLGHSLIGSELDPKGALRLLKGQGRAIAKEGMVPAKSYLGALCALQPGRARKMFSNLSTRMPELREHFLSVDEDTPLAKAYRDVWQGQSANTPDLAVYYHLPFTGGTSLQRALNTVYAKRNRFNIKRRAGLVNIEKLGNLTDHRMNLLWFVHLHHPFPVDWRGRNMRMFTILRDPVSYFLSGHFKRRNRGRQAIMADRSVLIEGGGLAEAVQHAQEHNMHDGLCRQLAVLHPRFADRFAQRYADPDSMVYTEFEDDLFYTQATAGLSPDDLLNLANEVLEQQFWPPGVLGHMDASYYAIMAELGFPVIPRLPHAGVSKRPPRDEIDPAIRQSIADFNTADQALYDQHNAVFEREHAALIAAVEGEKSSG